MTVARSVADVLADHVVFEVESIDRMYLNVWQPRLTYGGGVQGFFVGHRGHHYASTALMDPMTKAFVADIHGFVAARGLELVPFAKGQRKDELTAQFLAGFTDEEGVLFIGRAQEKVGVWCTQRRHNSVTGGSYTWLVGASAFINFFYFYCVDADFGPFFLKFSTYFPYTAKLCLNGNEWAKRQAAKAGIGFAPLDNGFSACDDVPALQQICDSLGGHHIEALRKWLRILPNPFTDEDETAGYRYELSILQAEFSRTQMFDRPVSGRIFFEQVLHDNLDIGRPDQIGLVFDRRIIRKGRHATPGRFRTESSPREWSRPCTSTTRTPRSCAACAGGRSRCRSGSADASNCVGDGGGPSGAALQGVASNHRMLCRLRAGVVSDAEKARRECVRYGSRRRARANHR